MTNFFLLNFGNGKVLQNQPTCHPPKYACALCNDFSAPLICMSQSVCNDFIRFDILNELISFMCVHTEYEKLNYDIRTISTNQQKVRGLKI
jgi:hypothetical protein